MTCGQCAFYHLGMCRLNPPQIFWDGRHVITTHPTRQPTDWCGQFRPIATQYETKSAKRSSKKELSS